MRNPKNYPLWIWGFGAFISMGVYFHAIVVCFWKQVVRSIYSSNSQDVRHNTIYTWPLVYLFKCTTRTCNTKSYTFYWEKKILLPYIPGGAGFHPSTVPFVPTIFVSNRVAMKINASRHLTCEVFVSILGCEKRKKDVRNILYVKRSAITAIFVARNTKPIQSILV